ncbi:MAG TPA: hypothetical protein VF380_00715, partial [Solirubrobacteraceae bacterium]
EPTETPGERPQAQPARSPRLPSPRAAAVLATVMLGIGVAVGAAVGPGPDSSFAGGPSAFAQRLPALLAAIAARQRAAAPAAQAASAPAAESEPAAGRRRRRRHRRASVAASPSPETAASTTPSAGEPTETSTTPKSGAGHQAKLPAISTVWLIQLAGGTFTQALAQPAATPYITSQLPAGTLLGGWSALEGGALANDAALAEPVSAEATPPLLHTIVQPPCPEGAAGATCAPETPGQLSTADEFLKATLATITTTPAYREHGLVVVTFASVGVAAQAGLPAGASSATLTYKPPAGVLLLSPFAQKGARSSVTFNPTSPRQSLEKLLH